MKHFFRQRSSQLTILMIASIALLASSGNPNNGNTGAPFDGQCSGCHGGSNSNGFAGDITVDGLPAAAVPGTTYPITVRMTANAGNPTRGGFQMVVVDGTNTDYGDLIAPSGSGAGTEMFGGREYVDHRNPKNFSGNGSEIVWNIQWKAIGAAASNTAKFYFIGNFCNGSGSGGDYQNLGNISIPVELPPSIDILVTSTDVSCFGGNNGTATASATTGTAPYTYLWSNSQTTSTVTSLMPGLYTVTVTDSGGATGTGNANIGQPAQALFAATLVTGSISCASSTASISTSATGGTSPYTYVWSNGATENPLEVSAAGTYTVTVFDANNCTKTATANVTGSTNAPIANATGSNQACGAASTTVSAMGSSTGGNIAYQWIAPAGGNIVSGANTALATVSGAGTYILVVTNTTNGCTSTDDAIVTVSTAPVVTATGAVLTCSNPIGALTAASTTPNVTFAWSGPGFMSMVQNPMVIQPGVYTVTVTNNSGCTTTASVTVVSEITPPALSVTTTTATCINPVSTATASSSTAGTTFSWTWPNGGPSNTPTIQLGAGTYTVVATNPANGCTASATATASSNTTPPTVALSPAAVLTCNVLQTSITATSTAANVSYAWNGASIVSGANSSTIILNQVGTYTVTITDLGNGCTATASQVVLQDILSPIAAIATPPTINCSNPAITLDASASSQGPNFVYAWSGGTIVGGANTLYPVVSEPNVYTLTVTNTANGCTAWASTTVLLATPVTVLTSNTNVSCFGGNNGTATAVGIGGNGVYTYQWSNMATTATATNLAAGSYFVTVTDGNGCTGTGVAVITQPAAALAANAVTTPTTGAGANNGTATANPTGGSDPYTYLWSNSGTTQTIENLAPGVYTVVVTDNNGCTAVQSVSVNDFSCVLGASISAINASCNGSNNGSVSITTQNATTPVLYLWSNQATTQQVQGLAPGVYTVTVADASNCSVVLSATISEPTPLVVTVNTTLETAIGANNATATATVNGGTAPYTYLWSNNETTAAIQNLAPGSYTVIVTDSNGCTSSQTAFINAFNCTGTPAIMVTHVLCAGGSEGALSASFVGGTVPVVYNWSNGANTQGIVGLSAGTYFLTMTDANGCIVLDTATVLEPAPLVAEIGAINNVTCTNEQSGSVVINVSGGGLIPYSYTYPGSGQNLLGVGAYTTTVTAPNGCTTTVSFTILAIDTIPPTIVCPDNIAGCDNGNNTSFGLPTVMDNCLPIGVQYSLIQGLPNGSYFPVGTTVQVYQVTDGAGNTSTCSFTVTTYPSPDVLIVSYTDDINGTGVGSIDITPIMGTAPYVFNWRKDGEPFATTEDLTNLNMGKYFLNVTDANGCQVALAPITIDNVVNTSTPFSDAGIRLWPNPVADQGVLFLSLSNNIQPQALQILNSVGQIAYSTTALTADNTLEIGQLPAGMYIALLTDQQGKRYFANFIKQ